MNVNGNTSLTDYDGRKIQVSIAVITPEEAAIRLKHMAHNRPVKTSKVERISAAMKEGKYMLNGQPLIEDSSGSTLDGQHRLHSCIHAGVPFRTLLVQGVSPDVFPTIDSSERKLPEILVAEYSLERNKAGTTAAVINLSYALRHAKTIHSRYFPSTLTALEFYNSERLQMDQRITEAGEKFKTKIALPIGKFVALYHEFGVTDSDVARKFFMAMCGLTHDVSAFSNLREMFVADISKKRRIAPRLKMAYCIKAFNSVLAGADFTPKMKKGEAFPAIGLQPQEVVNE